MKVLSGRALVSGETWEERAFAEDASGEFGGYLWPPRSYTCSYCSREFMSAQALGGHMNVHRRDRALLRQPEYASTEAIQVQERAPYFGCTAAYPQDGVHDGYSLTTPQSITTSYGGVPDSSYERSCNEEADLSITLNSFTNYSQPTALHSGWGKDSDLLSAHINQHHLGGVCSPRGALTGVDLRLVNDLDLELRLGLHPS
ncbi:hypothetical protein MLD38_002638 [Melastoma candidum]|uniref:Uncharacterized protein n=1 Tax=Melastoma candidum TaxID=119954 RepID=A0ACB9S1I1_9MYRT|nr:hypothetical protein MLD38_002638 [Melastoma candidum]